MEMAQMLTVTHFSIDFSRKAKINPQDKLILYKFRNDARGRKENMMSVFTHVADI